MLQGESGNKTMLTTLTLNCSQFNKVLNTMILNVSEVNRTLLKSEERLLVTVIVGLQKDFSML